MFLHNMYTFLNKILKVFSWGSLHMGAHLNFAGFDLLCPMLMVKYGHVMIILTRLLLDDPPRDIQQVLRSNFHH